MTIRPRRQVPNPDQIPLITPDSDWVIPSELPDLRQVREIAIDTEERDEGLAGGRGPGWAFGAGRVVGVCAAWGDADDIRRLYVPIGHPDTANFPKDNVARWLRDILRPETRKVFFNAGYDIGWLQSDLGVKVQGLIDDASCAAVMIDETRRPTSEFPKAYSLDAVCAWRGLPRKDTALLREAAVAYGVAPAQAVANIWRYPARYAGPYGEQDAESTLLLMRDLRPELARQSLLQAYQTEMDLVPVVHEMRQRGVAVNVGKATQLRDMLLARRDRAFSILRDKMSDSRIGMDEIRSRPWLIRAFESQGVQYALDGGEVSFERDWMRAGTLERGGQPHWLPRLIAEAKQCHEAATKFVQGYVIDFAHVGRIHASINQFKSEEGGTRTHRFSYADPPLQQMPSRGEMFLDDWPITQEIADGIRDCFEAERGELWFAPDYSQQEYRLIVHYAAAHRCPKADEAVEKYQRDPQTDFHNLVVDMTGLTRRRAKDCNFAKAFGAGIPKFASMINAEVEEAGRIMSQYDTEMPFVKDLNQKCDKAAQRQGHILMIDGARGHFNLWEAAWLSREERDRGWRSHLPMGECDLPEAQRRVADAEHPWYGKRLKRAHTHKAMNMKIQGSGARMTKRAMVAIHRELGLVPLLQMHDELGFSLSDPTLGSRAAELMRVTTPLRVPVRVDEEWGATWGRAKYSYQEAAGLAGLVRPARRAAGAGKQGRAG